MRNYNINSLEDDGKVSPIKWKNCCKHTNRFSEAALNQNLKHPLSLILKWESLINVPERFHWPTGLIVWSFPLLAGELEPAVHFIRPRGLRHHAGLTGRQEVPRRGHHTQLQGQVPAQGRQEGAAFVSDCPTKPNQTRRDQTKPVRTKPGQVKPDFTKTN